MGHERPLRLDPLVQGPELGTIGIDGEPGNHPDHLAQKVHDSGDVVELHPQPLGAQFDDLQPGGFRPGALAVGVAGTALLVRLRSEEVLDEFVRAGGPDVLGEVRAAGAQNAGDLGPVRGDGVPAHDQVEGVGGEGQRCVVRYGDDRHAARVEQGGGLGDVRRPALGGDGERGQLRGGVQHFSAPGVHIERGGHAGQPLPHGPGVPPRGPRLGGPAVEPGEVPAVGGDGGAFDEELFEGRGGRGHGHEGDIRRQLSEGADNFRRNAGSQNGNGTEAEVVRDMLYADDETTTLRAKLDQERDAVLWKLEGLDDEQVRRAVTPSGTSLLGLVKHLASVEYGWFVETFGRETEPFWFDPYLGEDMSADQDETTAQITDFYARARAAADRVLTELPLDTLGKPAWRDDECSLRWVLVRMTAETARHAGHMDIVRELIDGATGEYEPS